MKNALILLYLLNVINCFGQISNEKTDDFASYINKLKVDPLVDYNNIKDSTMNRGLAVNLIWSKRYEKAIDLLKKEIIVNSSNVSAIHLIGHAYNESGFPEKSLPYFNKAIEMIPNEYTYHYNRGLAYYRIKQYKKAIDDYTVTIINNQKDTLAFFNRALAYEGLRDFESAIKDYNIELTINGEKARIYNNRGRCYMILKKFDLALNDFNKALEIEPNKANAIANRGNVYAQTNQLDKACLDWQKATELGSNQKELIKKYCSQTQTDISFIGEWIVQEVIIPKDSFPKEKKEELNDLISAFKTCLFKFEENGNFKFDFSLDEMKISNGKWTYDSLNKIVKITEPGKVESIFMIFQVEIKTNGDVFFILQESPVVLKMKKRL